MHVRWTCACMGMRAEGGSSPGICGWGCATASFHRQRSRLAEPCMRAHKQVVVGDAPAALAMLAQAQGKAQACLRAGPVAELPAVCVAAPHLSTSSTRGWWTCWMVKWVALSRPSSSTVAVLGTGALPAGPCCCLWGC